MKKLKTDYIYRIKLHDGEIVNAQYIGRQRGFECAVCRRGNNSYTFNVWYSIDGYETYGFGQEHMPEILEEIGEMTDENKLN